VLDFEVVRDWSTGHDEYWGKLAHFAIGWKGCTVVTGKLGDLMQMNQKRIGFDDATLNQGSAFRVGRDGFVPLADVPDYCFITAKSRPSEGVQHFADVDIQDIAGGDSILTRCLDNPANVSAKVWKAYFDGFAEAGVGPDEGCLPFRVWQIWKAMVDYLKDHDLKRFLAAAGILAHYIGDASMPFHCSYMHHGIPPMVDYDGREYPAPRKSDAFESFKKSREYKIHSIFDETLLEVDPEDVFKKVDHEVRRLRSRLNISSGYDAAVETVKLMGATQKRLPPERIIKADDPELSVKKRAERLWELEWIREGLVASLAQSVHLLSGLWNSAWEIGGGERQQLPKKAFTEAELQKIYRNDRSFIPSLNLADLVEDGSFEPPRRRMAAAGGR
jgi:hypothetical protein